MNTTIAIVSDLHCHHSSQGPAGTLLLSDAMRLPANQHPVQALLELIDREQLSSELLLIPGDISNRVDSQGLNSGWALIHEIGAKLGSEEVVATVGNHDVASRSPEGSPFDLVRSLFPSFPTRHPALNDSFWSQGFCVVDTTSANLLVINSCFDHRNAESAKRGLFCEKNRDSIREAFLNRAARPFRVALCHHHPLQHEDLGLGADDLMENGSILTALLEELDFTILIHGHKHHARLMQAQGTGTLPILASGSFSAGLPPTIGSRTKNLFHIVELNDVATVGCRPVHGKVRTWQFGVRLGWSPSTCSGADFPNVTGFGCSVDVDELVKQTLEKIVPRQSEIMPWQEVIREIPALEYVPPLVLKRYVDKLLENKIKAVPSAPDAPELLWKL